MSQMLAPDSGGLIPAHVGIESTGQDPNTFGQTQLLAAKHVLTGQASLSQWYMPSNHDDRESSIDITESAYNKALKFHGEQFGRNQTNTWLTPRSSICDVLNVLAEAQNKYTEKKLSRRKSSVIMASWWKAVSSKMMQYEKVVDTLVSSHPEYSALVWGAMRFLFTVTLNHEELSSKIAQSFAEIGSVLPEVDFIAQKLYPTESIQVTLAHVYAQLLEFCTRATAWYNRVQSNPIKKVLTAITKTWPLEFQDIRLNIDRYFRRLREQSAVAHQAETRDIHRKISDIRIMLSEKSSIQQAFGSEATTIRLNPSILKMLPLIQERVSLYLRCSTPDSNQTLEVGAAMRDRRRARGGFGHPGVWTSAELREWISKPDSALLQLRGSLLRAEETRDIALDLVQLLRSVELPAIWYVGTACSVESGPAKRVPVADVLRSLIQQTIDQHTEVLQTWDINETRFQDCKSDRDWLRVFISVLSQIERIAIVVDAHQDVTEILGMISQFWDIASRDNIKTIVKILVLTYDASPGLLGSFPLLPTTSKVGSSRLARGPGALARPGRGNSRFLSQRRKTYRSLQIAGPEEFKPYVLQFVNVGKG